MTNLDPERQKKAKELSRINHRLYWLDMAIGLGAMLLLVLTDLSLNLRAALDVNRWLQIPAYAAVVFGSIMVLTFPLTVYSGYIFPKRFGLSPQSLKSWLWDRIKGGLLGAIIGLPILLLVYYLLANFPGTWWLFAWGAIVAVSVLMAIILPVFLIRVFFKLKPLNDQELNNRINSLADKTGARVKGVFTIDYSSKSTGANAFVAGLGGTRRIVLTDTMIQQYTPQEIEVVLAHELGHHVHWDVPKGILITSLLTLVELYLAYLFLKWVIPHTNFSGIDDVAALPLLAIVFGTVAFISRPALNWNSRRIEADADRFSIAVTRDLPSFESAMVRLTDQNLSDAEPSAWEKALFYSHPPFPERVRLARATMSKLGASSN
ncbi:MAG: M48 family peptidase [Dehalococcoidia bacterium]|nr:M48 family peptidase [Dehalococcoidia bacterium]